MNINNNYSLLRLISAVLVVIATLVMAGCGDIYGHEEFEKLVKNRSETEVQKELGKPASVDSSNPARVVWIYNSVTYDIDKNNARDPKTKLVFTPAGGSGKLQVAEIAYTP